MIAIDLLKGCFDAVIIIISFVVLLHKLSKLQIIKL